MMNALKFLIRRKIRAAAKRPNSPAGGLLPIKVGTGNESASTGRCKGFARLACFTANTESPESPEMRLSASISTANVADAADGDWVLISPYGDHPSPDGTYTQNFSRNQAEKVVRTWNSITGTAARAFKNLWHGLGGTSCPVWDGHPETDKRRWPKAKLLAEITGLRTGEDGLEGRIRWTGNARPKGPLYPSPLWWHWPAQGEPPAVFPELLESIGLVPEPNIKSTPAWTANFSGFGLGDPELEIEPTPIKEPTQTQNTMNRIKLLKMLGLAADATDEQINTAMDGTLVTANALATANAAQADLETQLATANASLTEATGSVTALTTERDTLQTANADLTTANGALTTANTDLVTGVLNIAEKRGAITPAERGDFQTRIATANTAASALTELQTRKAMHTTSVEIAGNRIDLSTANARATALETAIAQRMKDGNISRDEAFAACRNDKSLAPIFDAMQDPTKLS
ncbi:MAG: hypothetical protein ABI615_01805 [Chthoniobacterales bacterium]